MFLLGTFFLTALISALRVLQTRESKKSLKAIGNLFFYKPIHLFFFPAREYETLFFAAICAQNISRFCFAALATAFLSQTYLFDASLTDIYAGFWIVICFTCLLLLSFLIGDYLPRIIGIRFPNAALRLSAPFASLFLILSFPISYIFLKISHSLSRFIYIDHLHEPITQVKQEIIDLIEDAGLGPTIDPHDKKLIESVLAFRERIAREVMVPRVDLFSLSADTTISEAAKRLLEEGYSRTPVYRNTVDNVVGVLMYKDILSKYMEYAEKGNDPKILDVPIESIQKNVLYTPETKKLSSLLQEFRKKQVHLAIVVDEYGGTEGIVTIEDILEEIVGDISDEYDQEEELYRITADGTWIIDARMNILDAEEQLEIIIPQDGDYDTIGGYIYHSAGSIPSKGFKIHNDSFDLEVLSSNEKAVEKVRIKPIAPEEAPEQARDTQK